MEKLKISMAIIVEGKYDKIKLSSIVDGVIIVTNGFRIYKDHDKAALIRYYAQHGGIAILTDSDTAGFRIRGHIKGIVPKGDIVNVYVPEIFGKEKRKTEPSKEGLLGVEGVPADIIREAFEKAGIISEKVADRELMTKLDFYELGLSGRPDSSRLRQLVCEKLSLPKKLTANALLEVVNTMLDKDSLQALIENLTSENNKDKENSVG